MPHDPGQEYRIRMTDGGRDSAYYRMTKIVILQKQRQGHGTYSLQSSEAGVYYFYLISDMQL